MRDRFAVGLCCKTSSSTPQMTKQGRLLGKHEVVAGCRRLRALRKLADLGKLANDEEILCKVVSKEVLSPPARPRTAAGRR